MPKLKDKREKYWPAEEVEELAKKIIDNSGNIFHYITISDFKFLFKKAKQRADKNIKTKIIKEPVSLISNKKVMVFVGDEWWNENIDSDRTKALIEALLSVTSSGDEINPYERRDYDLQSFNELLTTSELDYSKFSKILPSEAKKEDLILS